MIERVIWERTIDHDKIRVREDRFRKRFAVVAAPLLLVVLIFGGVRNAIAIAAVLALAGLAWGYTVRMQSLSDQANPRLVVDGGLLILGRREIIIEDITRYTTMATVVQTSLLGKHSQLQIGKAVFRMDVPGGRRDPQLIEFGWPNMDETGVEGVKEALAGVLDGKWVEPVELVAEDELPRRRRRR